MSEVVRSEVSSEYRFFPSTWGEYGKDPAVVTVADLEDAAMRLRMVGAVGDERVDLDPSGYAISCAIASDDLLPRAAISMVRESRLIRAKRCATIFGLVALGASALDVVLLVT